MKRIAFRKTVITSTVALAIAGGMVGVAQPAYAAPDCSTTVNVHVPQYPVHKVVPATGSGSVDCELGYGNQSSAVRALQVSLNYCHGAGLDTDGMYGPATRNAVRNVQRAKGIPVDGRYGPQTRNAMNHAYFWDAGGFQNCGPYA
ncbi:peptidoglycan-binding domain-containing protein [Cryptosporangium arvum]|uniref:Putative peptidoglycan-binding domain-containing protein n=1 Tax=Cryptosporangium arvum DSM 44712 TaxID=927661 RepID=A0A010ZYB4_9ACTN|nr:peptidoglycan-binding domain-containing protein [Cryptosporangium arvum]EXG82197.1 putative peptidoglycan-binding domain-containing protein [Cryptosporangium arvum DSM 44712]